MAAKKRVKSKSKVGGRDAGRARSAVEIERLPLYLAGSVAIKADDKNEVAISMKEPDVVRITRLVEPMTRIVVEVLRPYVRALYERGKWSLGFDEACKAIRASKLVEKTLYIAEDAPVRIEQSSGTTASECLAMLSEPLWPGCGSLAASGPGCGSLAPLANFHVSTTDAR